MERFRFSLVSAMSWAWEHIRLPLIILIYFLLFSGFWSILFAAPAAFLTAIVSLIEGAKPFCFARHLLLGELRIWACLSVLLSVLSCVAELVLYTKWLWVRPPKSGSETYPCPVLSVHAALLVRLCMFLEKGCDVAAYPYVKPAGTCLIPSTQRRGMPWLLIVSVFPCCSGMVSAAPMAGYAVYALFYLETWFDVGTLFLDSLGVWGVLTIILAFSGCLAEVFMVPLRWINVHCGNCLPLPEKGYFAVFYYQFAIAKTVRSFRISDGVVESSLA